MAKYLVIYRADPAARAAMPEPTAEQAQQMGAAWMGWRDRIGDALVDFGDPTSPVDDADPSVGGYTIVEADDAQAARALLDGHPHRAMGGKIDLYELTPFPMG